MLALAERGRRVISLHLPDNSGVTLRMLAQVAHAAIKAVAAVKGVEMEAAAAAEAIAAVVDSSVKKA